MFREMRRKKQQLSEAECLSVIERNTAGVLAVSGDEGYPYAVPLSYVYLDGAIYFHSAKSGHKLDAIRQNDKVSFCIIDQDQVIPEKYTTYYRSVIVFGRAVILEDAEEILSAIEKLAVKYHPTDTPENRDAAIGRELHALAMVKIEIAHITGKQAIELARKEKKETP